MFFHNFKYTLKTLLKNRMLVFWTFAFPILLGLFFNMAFSSIEESETFDTLDIAVVNDDNFKNNQAFKSALKELSSGKNKIFNTKYVDLDKAKKLLSKDKIVGYLVFENENPKIVVTTNGSYETIFKNVIDEINQIVLITNTTMEDKIKKEISLGNTQIDYQELSTKIKKEIESANSNIEDTTSNNLSYVLIEFYTLIAMTCLYGGVVGMEAMNQSLPNMDNKGKRIAVSPTKKIQIVLSSLLASYIVQLLGVFLLFIFLLFVLNIDFGNHILLCIILSIVGSLAGLSIGLFISTIIKSNENNKVGIIIAISMFCSFLSGMMGITMKYIIDKNIPLLNMINPGNMITDGFYSLYYYNTYDRYIFNVSSLIIFSVVLLTISGLILRRQKYDSI